ncbi:MAG: MazG family protein, partial [Stackebrandtia sp.]
IMAAGVPVTVMNPDAAVATLLRDGGVWLAAGDGDEPLARRLAAKLAAEPTAAELELLTGSWDPPGARLLDAVAVVDRLRSPGGCPWDAEQTHRSLAPFLLEETYETIDAIESGDLADLREELGDVLMQPLLHARFASENDDGFSIDDVAAGAVEKLIRRHPHVFGDEEVAHVDQLRDRWDELKRAEKPHRSYATDGVPTAQPALSLAGKYLARTARAGVDITAPAPPAGFDAGSAAALGEALLGVVAAARDADIDPELALREAALRFAGRARDIEDAHRD